MNRKTIAAHIPTYNCPDLLLKCLSHTLWVDEIVIADNSTNNDIRDLIPQIKHPNVKYIHSQQPDIRIRLLDLRDQMESDYILWVCTDEFYTEDAAKEILDALSDEASLKDGYVVTAKTYHYGVYDPDGLSHIRLFRKEKFYFELKSIHEQARVDGTVGLIQNHYDHIQLERLASQASKIFFYADNDARIKHSTNLEAVRTDKLSSLQIKIHFYKQLLRIFWRTRRMFFQRNASHVDLFKRYEQILTVIANDSVPTEVIIQREGNAKTYFEDASIFKIDGKAEHTGIVTP